MGNSKRKMGIRQGINITLKTSSAVISACFVPNVDLVLHYIILHVNYVLQEAGQGRNAAPPLKQT